MSVHHESKLADSLVQFLRSRSLASGLSPQRMRGYLPGHTPDLQNGGVASYEIDERGVVIAQLWDSLAPQI